MSKVIKIDLEKVRDAQSFSDSSEIIQQEAIQQFFLQVYKTYEKISDFKIDLDRKNSFSLSRMRYHDTITITGFRGSGKTTFVLNMLSLIQNETPTKDENTDISDIPELKILRKEVKVLGILDPTLIEEKEHIFVNIISRIKVLVDLHREGTPEKASHNFDCPTRSNDKRNSGCYQDWLNCLKTLAAGLPALDGVGSDDFRKSEQWHDPIHVMENGLTQAQASNDLEINFHHYIDKSLKFIGKEAFILAFDDIDTKFPAGWPVLETIRKYLTSPQLIIVLSGDFDLYSKLVRKQQWKNFGKALLINERKLQQLSDNSTSRTNERDYGKDSFFHIVDKLEEQYLLKVLKPEKRIELNSLSQLTTLNSKYEIKVTRKDKVIDDITTCVEEIFRFVHQLDPCQKTFERPNERPTNADLEFYRDNLLREPVRTVVQFLYAHNDFLTGPSPVSLSSELVVGQDTINALANIFEGALREYGFEPEFAKHPNPRTALNQLVIKLAEAGILERGYRLKAEFDDRSLNRLIWVLGALFVHLFRHHSHLYFDYIIKVGLSREMALRLPAISQQKRGTLDDYLDWVGIKSGEDTMTIARMATGPLRSFVDSATKTTPNHLGTIALRAYDRKRGRLITDPTNLSEMQQLYNNIPKDALFTDESLAELANDNNTNEHILTFFKNTLASRPEVSLKDHPPVMHKAYYINSLPELELNITSWQRCLINLPAKQLVDKFGTRTTFYSIHSLLAFIGVILDNKDILSSLNKFSQLRDYPWPKWGEMENVPTQQDPNDSEETLGNNPYQPEKSTDTALDAFTEAIKSWRTKFNEVVEKQPIPPHIWSKVFTRFYYSLGRIDSAIKRKDRYLGFLVHRYIIVFLNSILIEEALYRDIDGLAKSLRSKINTPHMVSEQMTPLISEGENSSGGILSRPKNISLKNPTDTDSTFTNNMNYIKQVSKDNAQAKRHNKQDNTDNKMASDNNPEVIFSILPFFTCIYTLPLLWNFINIEDITSDPSAAQSVKFKYGAITYIRDKYYDNKTLSTPEDLFTCKYCNSTSFRNLYPMLNSVPIHFGKPTSLSSQRSMITSSTSKPVLSSANQKHWGMGLFNGFIKGKEVEIKNTLRPCPNIDKATSTFIDKYLIPNFKKVPTPNYAIGIEKITRAIIEAGLYPK